MINLKPNVVATEKYVEDSLNKLKVALPTKLSEFKNDLYGTDTRVLFDTSIDKYTLVEGMPYFQGAGILDEDTINNIKFIINVGEETVTEADFPLQKTEVEEGSGIYLYVSNAINISNGYSLYKLLVDGEYVEGDIYEIIVNASGIDKCIVTSSSTKKINSEYLEYQVPDWNQNNSVATGYIMNRPFYTSDPTYFCNDENIGEPDSTQTDRYFYKRDTIYHGEFTIGETYHIVLDGVKYTHVAYKDGNNKNAIGNYSIYSNSQVEGSNTDPYYAYFYDGYLWLYTKERVTSVEIFADDAEVYKIDSKYLDLPSGVVSCQTAEVGQMIIVKSVDDNGLPVEWEAVNGQSSRDYLTLKDVSNGYDYKVFMKDGSLTSTMDYKILIKSLPTKTDYTDSDTFDPTGMIIVKLSSDGTEEDITDKVEYDNDINIGSSYHEIRFTENGFTNTVNINITTKSLETALQDFTYTTNSDGTYTLIKWKGTLNGVSSTKCVIPNSDLVIL